VINRIRNAKKSRLIAIVFLMTLAAVLVFYMAPSKYRYGDAFIFLYWIFFVWWCFQHMRLLLPFANSINFLKNEASGLIKLHAVFVIQTIFIFCLWVAGIEIDGEVLDKLLWGLAAYLSIFFLFTRFVFINPTLIVGSVLVIAGFVHLCLMYVDIGAAYWDGRLVFAGNPRWGLLEGIKDLPRVGRKYLSFAMINMIFGCLILAINNPIKKRYFYFVGALGVIAIVLVDARSAYVSIFLIAVILLIFKWRTIFFKVAGMRLIGLQPILALCLILIILTFAYESGKSRWGFMAYSFSKAYEHVFVSIEPVVLRPYVNEDFWSAPILNLREYYANHEFRCEVDSSAYLRMAWLLEGVRQAVDHPFGVGGSPNYMGRIWGVEGVESKFQRVDSEFIMFFVSYGLVGLFFYFIMLFSAMMPICRPSKTKLDWVVVSISSLVITMLIRGMFDTISDGLWRCMMVLCGCVAAIEYFSMRLKCPFSGEKSLEGDCR
jgi:O-Antigen ligase